MTRSLHLSLLATLALGATLFGPAARGVAGRKWIANGSVLR